MIAFSGAALDWLADETGIAARDLVITPMRGANSSAVYQVCDGTTQCFVLRVFIDADWLATEPDLAVHEADALAQAMCCPIDSPALAAFEADDVGFGGPIVLMSLLSGNVDLQPRDLRDWTAQLARTLARIHAHQTHNFGWEYRSWIEPTSVKVPRWTKQPQLWERAIELWRGGEPQENAVFLHRDFHPCNVLWKNGKVSGVVDWVNACMGPRGVDVAHCRTNLAVLFGVDVADDFRDDYLEIAGGEHHPFWDVNSILDLSLPQPEFYPPWREFGLDEISCAEMGRRNEVYLQSVMRLVSE